MGGLFSSLMAFDFGKAVVDNEIALMDKRAYRGLEFSEENLALEEIAAVGPGGSYMGRKHTKARMKTTAVLPRLANRDMRAQWEDAGKPHIHDRAMDEARRILAQSNDAVWDDELDAQIREHFPGLVAGDATPLEG
jgi:trimethylamine--corrinoid protein Co-methyltransferase